MLNQSQDPLDQTVPYYPQKPPANPAVTQVFDITAGINETGHLLFFVDNSSFRANFK